MVGAAAAASKHSLSWGTTAFHSRCKETGEAAFRCLPGVAQPARCSPPGSEGKGLGSYLGKNLPFSTQKHWAVGDCVMVWSVPLCPDGSGCGFGERGDMVPFLLRRSQSPIGLLGGFLRCRPLLPLVNSLALSGVSWLGEAHN